ncbi:AAA family ATPase [Acidovorax sp. GBBC 3332]|nr:MULTISPECIES: AAA family ATPase [unclassified Acidovorax]MDA8449812.1 AAA family ATPase [Acidovorax sp. GBBC 3297]MDA8459257.1 AAA family ATPase [Acidovorax sp. GBBC 3333]MDA8464294.1 AAA family ATPase [Acidovorax sp. GBBC 3332]MDA8469496.1 AAA family ATPase [Acidovorax sp. GBBC 3299]
MLRLRADLTAVGSSQSDCARQTGVSTATICVAINYDKWPKGRPNKAVLQERIRQFLLSRGASPETVAHTFDEAPAAPRANARRQAMAQATHSGPQPGTTQDEDDHMLLRHYKLTPEARRHFKILRDPFVDEMRDERDVFASDDIRYVRAAMRHTAKHGGMLAVVAESGGGKSILRKDLNQWIADAGEPITVIEPFVLGMAASERDGAPLRAADIIAAVIRTVAPGSSLPQRLQDRSDRMKRVLQGSAQVGRKHVVIIEEAHALATPTIKALKRFYELEDGFKKLLAVILIGQTELEDKLSENDPEVREVVQRCELIRLPPLDNHVAAYLEHKFKRADMDMTGILAPDALEAIREVLRQSETKTHRGKRETRERSLCHPLAINNLVTRAMNEAVRIGAPKVTAPLIAAAMRGD